MAGIVGTCPWCGAHLIDFEGFGTRTPERDEVDSQRHMCEAKSRHLAMEHLGWQPCKVEGCNGHAVVLLLDLDRDPSEPAYRRHLRTPRLLCEYHRDRSEFIRETFDGRLLFDDSEANWHR